MAKLTRTLHILDKTGDTTLTWTVDDEKAIVKAAEAFTKAAAEGYWAAKTVRGGNEEIIKKFDATATKIVMAPQIVGG